MMKLSRAVLAIGGLGLALTQCRIAMADDAAAKLAEAPAAVQAMAKQALGSRAPEEVVKEKLGDNVVYEVGWKEGNVDHAAIIDTSGKLVLTEADVELNKVPAAVMEAAKKALPGGKVAEAALAIGDGREFYTLDVKVGKDAHVLEVAADGKVISDQIEKPVADDAK